MEAASDSETPEEFGGRLLEAAQGGFVAAGIAMGKDMGLFEAMRELGKPATVQEIADRAAAKERYTREWLGIMVTGRVVDYNHSKETYFISAEKLAAMEDAVYYSCWLTRCLGTYPQLMKAFPKHGPPGFAPWEHVDFDSLIRRDKEGWLTDEKIDKFVDDVPGLKEKLASGISVCDAGCNTAPFLLLLAAKYPASHFTGFDLSESAIETARSVAAEKGLKNVTLAVHNIYDLPSAWRDKFDYLRVYDVIHDLPRPEQAVQSLRDVIKPQGVMSLVEFNFSCRLSSNLNVPNIRSYYSMSMFYCLPTSMHYGGEGAGLLWGRENVENALHVAGFAVDKMVEATRPDMQIHYVCRKQPVK